MLSNSIGSSNPSQNAKAKARKLSSSYFKDLKEELLNIKNYVLNNEIEQNIEFDKVIITKKDKIIPYSAQKLFWERHNNVIEIDSGHFPFFEFNDFDEILEG